jgi:hypothetical protein
MSVLHAQELKIFLPIRPFLRERRIAETRFHPGRYPGWIDPSLLHIVLIFVARDGAFPERLLMDGAQKRFFRARLDSSFNEIAHKSGIGILPMIQ